MPLPWQRTSLAGAQLKVSVKQTIGCERCWSEFTANLPEAAYGS